MAERNSTRRKRLERQYTQDTQSQEAQTTTRDEYLWADESKYVWLQADGEQIPVQPVTSKTKFSLAELRRFVGGSVQLASLDSHIPYADVRGGLVRDSGYWS